MYFSPPHKRIVTDKFLNPLHPKNSMHILHTVLRAFPKVLAGRIWFTIKSFVSDRLIYSRNIEV